MEKVVGASGDVGIIAKEPSTEPVTCVDVLSIHGIRAPAQVVDDVVEPRVVYVRPKKVTGYATNRRRRPGKAHLPRRNRGASVSAGRSRRERSKDYETMQVDPANVRITAHFGLRLAEQAIKQGGDPDEARRARGEADFLPSRAQKLAPDDEEVKQLRDQVVKLLGLKTN